MRSRKFWFGAPLAVCLVVVVAACVGDDPTADENGLPDGAVDGTTAQDGNGNPADSGGTDTTDSGEPSDAGGDGGSFLPSSIPGLTLWLDATRGIAPGASTVTNWVDQVTLRAVQGNVAYGDGGTCAPPSVIPGEVKGNPIVRFNGSSNCLVMGDSFFDRFRDFTKGLTAFIVAKPGTEAADDEAVLDFGVRAHTANDFLAITRDGLRPKYYVQNPMYGLQTAATTSSAFLASETHLLTTSVKGADAGAFTSPGDVAFFIDGNATVISSTPVVHIPAVVNRSMSTIGRFVPGNGIPTVNAPGWYRGDLAEIVLYLRELTASERDQVTSYLRAKWLP